MDRKEYCKNCKCAKATISISGRPDKIVVSNTPPLIVETFGFEEFTHQMTAPIEREYEGNIIRVELVEGWWSINTSMSGGLARCPMPGIYPLVEVGAQYQADVDAGTVTDMYWEGNKLFCYFDRVGAYFNNLGACTYRVFTADASFKFSDLRGNLYEHREDDVRLEYKVDCDDCCKDTEIMCDHHKYPGYKCYPIPPINSQLANNRYDISRFYK